MEDDDLRQCPSCMEHLPWEEFHGDSETCAECEAEAEHERQLRSDYYATR